MSIISGSGFGSGQAGDVGIAVGASISGLGGGLSLDAGYSQFGNGGSVSVSTGSKAAEDN